MNHHLKALLPLAGLLLVGFIIGYGSGTVSHESASEIITKKSYQYQLVLVDTEGKEIVCPMKKEDADYIKLVGKFNVRTISIKGLE